MAASCHLAQAISLSVPKLLIDNAVAKKFPKEKLTVTLNNPSTRFSKERQKLELCGTWASKLLRQQGDFCIDFTPQWNKVKGDIEISKLSIVKLNYGEDKALPESVASALSSSVLTLLDGTAVYHVPDMVGKYLETIEVQDASLKLGF